MFVNDVGVFRFTPGLKRALLATQIFPNLAFENFEQFHLPQIEFNSIYCNSCRDESRFLPGFLQVLYITDVFSYVALEIFEQFHLPNSFLILTIINGAGICMFLPGFLRILLVTVIARILLLKSSQNFVWAVSFDSNCFEF